MTKAVSDAIADARIELKDVAEGNYTYSQNDMARFCGEAVLELRRVRPSTRYDEDLTLLADDDTWASLVEGQESVTLPGENRFYPAIPAFIIYRCLSRDVTDESNLAVAKIWYERFAAIAGG